MRRIGRKRLTDAKSSAIRDVHSLCDDPLGAHIRLAGYLEPLVSRLRFGSFQGSGGYEMEQRFAVLAEGENPKIYNVPYKMMARFIIEFPFRKVKIFETLNERMVAA